MVDYVSDGVDHDNCRHDYLITYFAASRAQAALSSLFYAQDFSHRSAGTGTDAALRNLLFRGSQASLVALFGARSDFRAAYVQQ
jgi:hypothetical protein